MNALTLNPYELDLLYRLLLRQDAASLGVAGNMEAKRSANRALDHLRADLLNALQADNESQNNG
ncbi:MAG: hypothetical protein AB7D26_13215 [Marinobacterium sp.]|jgi:hypothetical protein